MNYEANEWTVMKMEEVESMSHQCIVRVLSSSVIH